MQQFPVPLFIDEETKIMGPMDLSQFIITGVPGAIILLVILITNNIMIGVGVAAILGGPTFFVAFGKINGENIPKIIKLAIRFLLNPKLFLWGKEGKEGLNLKEIKRVIKEKEKEIAYKEKSKLKETLWDVHTGKK